MSFRGQIRRSLPVFLGLLVMIGAPLRAADFAVETQIYASLDEKPIATHLTVFRDGVIYDFQLTPVQAATSFDTKTRRFTLTDKANASQTALSANDLIRFAAQMRQKAMANKDPLVRFAADPVFEEEFNRDANRLALTSKQWEYHVKTKQLEDKEILDQYREFADWFTYLNSMFRPLPPGLRLKLNRALGQHDCFPQEVAVTIKIGRRKVNQYSKHQLRTRLGDREIDMIEKFRANHDRFASVDFAAYRKLVRTPE